MLELGSTSIRLGHQQRDPFVYRRADQTGLVVWAEIPLINRIQDTAEFTDNIRQQPSTISRASKSIGHGTHP